MLFLLLREDLLEHLVLLAQVVLMLRVGLLGPRGVLHRVPFRLRIISLLVLLGGRNRGLHPRGHLLGGLPECLGTAVFRHGFGRGRLAFHQVNGDVGRGRGSCHFLPLLGLGELPGGGEL